MFFVTKILFLESQMGKRKSEFGDINTDDTESRRSVKTNYFVHPTFIFVMPNFI